MKSEFKPITYDQPDYKPAVTEGRFHNYIGSRIPWYVRLVWIMFWVFAVVYVIRYLFPNLQTEILNPP